MAHGARTLAKVPIMSDNATSTPARVILKAKRDRSVRQGHPWVFSGSVQRVEGEAAPGEIVVVTDSNGQALASGFYNPQSAIRVRLLAPGHLTEDRARLRVKQCLTRAIESRRRLFDPAETDAFRIVNGEGDGLSGLIIDAYAGHLVIQPLAFWVGARLDWLVDTLREIWGPDLLQGLWLRPRAEASNQEGMSLEEGRLDGGDPTQNLIRIREGGLLYDVDVAAGQKTGFYLDQRDNRLALRNFCKDARVLNLFAYTGGFSLNALKGGAREVVSVDSSAPAMESLARHIELNDFSSTSVAKVADVKQILPEMERAGERFDVVVCDPPALAKRRNSVDRAARAYKDFNRRAMLMIDDGVLFTFSCSPFIDATLFRKMVFSAAVDSGHEAAVLRVLGPGLDHPVDLRHPEGDYLNGLILRIRKH